MQSSPHRVRTATCDQQGIFPFCDLLTDQFTSDKASQVRSRLAADFTAWETSNGRFEHAVEQLIRALRADAGARDQPPPTRL